jgi:hypothetical protein
LFYLRKYIFFIFSSLLVLSVFISLTCFVVVGYLQDLGWNFIDPIPSESNPTGAGVGENPTILSSISKSLVITILPSASCNEVIQYVEYVPRPVPRAPCSTNKRVRADDTSASTSATKKPCPLKNRLGTQVIGIMLLGERVNIHYFSMIFLFVSLLESSFLFRW